MQNLCVKVEQRFYLEVISFGLSRLLENGVLDELNGKYTILSQYLTEIKNCENINLKHISIEYISKVLINKAMEVNNFSLISFKEHQLLNFLFVHKNFPIGKAFQNFCMFFKEGEENEN